MTNAVVRIGCSVSLRAELWDALSGADERIRAEEEKRLAAAGKNAAALPRGDDAVPLDAQERALGQEQPKATPTSIVLPDLVPMRWHLQRHSFRKGDEFKARFPLSALPVHPSALRVLTCSVRLEAIAPGAWEAGIVRGERGPGGALRSQPTTGPGDDEADFVGVALSYEAEVTHGAVPSFELPFHDYIGLLSTKKVRPGLEFDESIPISESVAKFLLGSPAEGLTVEWVDADDEPDFGRYRPQLTKRKKKTSSKSKSSRPAQSKESYLDAIAHACDMLGVVPRIVGARLELGFARTIYEGRETAQTRAARPTILVSSVVESIKAKHTLLGAKTRAIQVVSFDPDSNQQHTARWPPAAGKNTALSSTTGVLPGVPMVAANVGIAGFEQLDEAIELVPVAPVADPSILPRLAESIFLEKNRQRVQYTLVTHCPWVDPTTPDAVGGALLRLRAGTEVGFGVGAITAGAGGRSMQGVRALTGELDEAGARLELEASGVKHDVAIALAAAIARTPKTDVFRVDELEVQGAEGEPAELRVGLVTYTTIVLDLQAKAGAPAGGAPAIVAAIGPKLSEAETRAKTHAQAVDARTKTRDLGLPPDEEEAQMKQIDELERAALKGK